MTLFCLGANFDWWFCFSLCGRISLWGLNLFREAKLFWNVVAIQVSTPNHQQRLMGRTAFVSILNVLAFHPRTKIICWLHCRRTDARKKTLFCNWQVMIARSNSRAFRTSASFLMLSSSHQLCLARAHRRSRNLLARARRGTKLMTHLL